MNIFLRYCVLLNDFQNASQCFICSFGFYVYHLFTALSAGLRISSTLFAALGCMFTPSLPHGCESLNLCLCLGCMFTCSPPVCCRVANLFICCFRLYVYQFTACLLQGYEYLNYFLCWVVQYVYPWLPQGYKSLNLYLLLCVVCLPPVCRRVASLLTSFHGFGLYVYHLFAAGLRSLCLYICALGCMFTCLPQGYESLGCMFTTCCCRRVTNI